MTRPRGYFITFEGMEGCGKSTQLLLLRDRLAAAGHDVYVTREPGGTPIGESIRAVLLNPESRGMAPITELLLYEAARAQIVAESIRPRIEAGTIVLCDRFSDSTTAYQGAGRGLSPDMLNSLHHLATEGLMPDLTFVLDVPVEVGLNRAARRCAADRIEQESFDFHERVRKAFLAIGQQETRRVLIMDGTGKVDEIADTIERATRDRLGLP